MFLIEKESKKERRKGEGGKKEERQGEREEIRKEK